jgi:hypothetical protein
MAEIELRRIGRKLATVTVKGTAPLIVHKFAEKARIQMLDAMQGRKKAKEHRDPNADFEGARHRLEDGRDGFPATGFKAAIVAGARYFDDKRLSMTILKQSIFVTGEGPDMLVPIKYDGVEPKMREDFVRVGISGTDLRYRPQYDDWSAELQVVYLPTLLSLDSVVALVDAGGLGGIGDWRPSSKHSATGVFGTFEVDNSVEIVEVDLNG